MGVFLIAVHTIVPCVFRLIEPVAGIPAANPGDTVGASMRWALLGAIVPWLACLMRGAYRLPWWRAALETPLVAAVFAAGHLAVYRPVDFPVVFALT